MKWLYLTMIRIIVTELGGVTADIDTYYLDTDLCNSSMYMADYNGTNVHTFLLKPSAEKYYPHNLKCSFTAQSQGNENLMLYFIRFSVGYNNCQKDWMELHDGNSITSPYVCAPCRSYEFECKNGRCIDESIKCNKYNPCGDSSDCDIKPDSGTERAVGLGLSIGFGLLFFVSVVVNIWLARKMKKKVPTTNTKMDMEKQQDEPMRNVNKEDGGNASGNMEDKNLQNPSTSRPRDQVERPRVEDNGGGNLKKDQKGSKVDMTMQQDESIRSINTAGGIKAYGSTEYQNLKQTDEDKRKLLGEKEAHDNPSPDASSSKKKGKENQKWKGKVPINEDHSSPDSSSSKNKVEPKQKPKGNITIHEVS